jgi:hypothetical protein
MAAHTWAQWSARRSWAVFRCRGMDDPAEPKRPARGIASWPRAATTDSATIRAWPSSATAYGIACRRSRLVVIDLDVAKDGSGETGQAALEQLCEDYGQPWPVTFTVDTPSGGKHLYFRADPERKVGNSRGALPKLIDVRGGGASNGGYVVGAGSVIPGGKYTVYGSVLALVTLPGWLAHLIARPPRTGATPQASRTGPVSDAYVRAALERQAAKVASATQPGRNTQLNASVYNLAAQFPEDALPAGAIIAAFREAGRQSGLPAWRIDPTIRSALRAARGHR